MRITYVIDHLKRAGTQQHVCQLTRELYKLGHQVQLICLEDKGDMAPELEELGVPIIAIGMGTIYKPQSLLKLRKLYQVIKSHHPEVLQTFLFKANVMGILAAGLARVPVILSSRRSLGYDSKVRRNLLLKIINPMTSGILVNSEAIRQTTIQQENSLPDKIHTIYNGIDCQPFDIPTSQETKLQLKIPREAPVIGIVANIRPVKGLEYLLEAMSTVTSETPSAHLVIVGNVYDNGEYHQSLLQKTKELDLIERVHFVHHCRNIPKIISTFDIAVLSSISEGFSNSVLEYMSAKKAIVVTKVGGNQEAIQHGESGVWVQPADAQALAAGILSLIQDPQKALKMGENASLRVQEHFTLKAMTCEYIRVYRSFLTRL